MECAALCYDAVQLMSLGSSKAAELCKICAALCEECAAECSQHSNKHCQECADACSKCATVCKKMSQSMCFSVVTLRAAGVPIRHINCLNKRHCDMLKKELNRIKEFKGNIEMEMLAMKISGK